MKRRIYLAAEFVLLFAGVPAALAALAPGFFVLPALWAVAVVCGVCLLRDPSFDRTRLWSLRGCWPVFASVAGRLLPAAAALAACVCVLAPGEFMGLPQASPRAWALTLLLYVPASVLPQGLVYRAFLFHRYRELASGRALWLLGACAFCVAHVPFGNAWALGLALIGGFLFGGTYLRSRSWVLSCLEHAVYGCLVFTFGGGAWLSNGTLRLARAFE